MVDRYLSLVKFIQKRLCVFFPFHNKKIQMNFVVEEEMCWLGTSAQYILTIISWSIPCKICNNSITSLVFQI
jgi:hypothetical protein